MLGRETDRACVLYSFSPQFLMSRISGAKMTMVIPRKEAPNVTRIYRILMAANRRGDESTIQGLRPERRLIEYHAHTCTGSECLLALQDLLLTLTLAECSWKLRAGLGGTTIVVTEVVSSGPAKGESKVFFLFTCPTMGDKGKKPVNAMGERGVAENDALGNNRPVDIEDKHEVVQGDGVTEAGPSRPQVGRD